MKLNIIQLEENDSIIVDINVGSMSISDVDVYMNRIINKFDNVFGKRPVIFRPVRDGIWGSDITIIRQPKNKIS
jgi:hypothetical protein